MGEDSTSAFNLTLAGTGLDFVTAVSPSGMWKLNSVIRGEFKPRDFYGPTPSLWVSNDAEATFLANDSLPFMRTQGYGDEPHNLGGPIIDGSQWFPSFYSREFQDWKGTTLFEIISAPDLADNSTWTWVANLSARGSAIKRNVPESGGFLCLAFAAGLLLFFKPRKEKAWTS